MKITEHFDSSEFDCKDGTKYPKEWYPRLKHLCEQLEVIRSLHDKEMTITSGYRTKGYNKKVNGAQFSRHLSGDAADIKIKGVSARVLYQEILTLAKDGKIKIGGIGSYEGWVHVDTRMVETLKTWVV